MSYQYNNAISKNLPNYSVKKDLTNGVTFIGGSNEEITKNDDGNFPIGTIQREKKATPENTNLSLDSEKVGEIFLVRDRDYNALGGMDGIKGRSILLSKIDNSYHKPEESNIPTPETDTDLDGRLHYFKDKKWKIDNDKFHICKFNNYDPSPLSIATGYALSRQHGYKSKHDNSTWLTKGFNVPGSIKTQIPKKIDIKINNDPFNESFISKAGYHKEIKHEKGKLDWGDTSRDLSASVLLGSRSHGIPIDTQKIVTNKPYGKTIGGYNQSGRQSLKAGIYGPLPGNFYS